MGDWYEDLARELEGEELMTDVPELPEWTDEELEAFYQQWLREHDDDTAPKDWRLRGMYHLGIVDLTETEMRVYEVTQNEAKRNSPLSS